MPKINFLSTKYYITNKFQAPNLQLHYNHLVIGIWSAKILFQFYRNLGGLDFLNCTLKYIGEERNKMAEKNFSVFGIFVAAVCLFLFIHFFIPIVAVFLLSKEVQMFDDYIETDSKYCEILLSRPLNFIFNFFPLKK